jgi:hypothetical protein
MKRTMLLSLFAVFSLTRVGTADEPSHRRADATATFETIKSLAGEWVQEVAGKTQIVSQIRLVAGGNSVMEVLFPGSDMERISKYSLDGDRVVMAHFCMHGNQPRFAAQADMNAIELRFLDAAGRDDGEKHIRAGRIELVDENRIRSVWTPFADGKAQAPHAFELMKSPANSSTQHTATSAAKSCCGGTAKPAR